MQLIHALFLVPKQHLHVLHVKQRVVHAGITGLHAPFQHNTLLAIPDLDHGHAVNRRLLVGFLAGVHDIVLADHHLDVILR